MRLFFRFFEKVHNYKSQEHKNRLYPSSKRKKIRNTFQKVLDINREISIPTEIQKSVYPATRFISCAPAFFISYAIQEKMFRENYSFVFSVV